MTAHKANKCTKCIYILLIIAITGSGTVNGIEPISAITGTAIVTGIFGASNFFYCKFAECCDERSVPGDIESKSIDWKCNFVDNRCIFRIKAVIVSHALWPTYSAAICCFCPFGPFTIDESVPEAVSYELPWNAGHGKELCG